MSVYTIQPVVQPVVQLAVSCIQTFSWLYNRLYSRLYNGLHRVYGVLGANEQTVAIRRDNFTPKQKCFQLQFELFVDGVQS